jgi:hypothetical protein
VKTIVNVDTLNTIEEYVTYFELDLLEDWAIGKPRKVREFQNTKRVATLLMTTYMHFYND